VRDWRLSRGPQDFLHWARLPVAIWNDQWYDAVAIFSGSTTIVDGKPVIVYPGLCNKTNCPKGSTYDAAVPANPADPLLTNWTKPSYNPLVNGKETPLLRHLCI
jgi:sucrose-6-phosphate hydrolase SacC (GH32 family)